MVENTARRDPIIHLLGALPAGTSGYIQRMEADGQHQIVNSADLPTDLNGDSVADFEAAGFTFGEPYEHDPMFRPATVPDGWKREGSDHDMWSYIVDQHGRRRVSVFYKAAFYDRKAHMNLTTPYGYLLPLVEEGGRPVLDDRWLTREVAVAEVEKIRDRHLRDAEEADEFSKRQDDTYWVERAAEHRQNAAKAEKLLAELMVTPGSAVSRG